MYSSVIGSGEFHGVLGYGDIVGCCDMVVLSFGLLRYPTTFFRVQINKILLSHIS